MNDSRESKPILCKNHGLVAYDICLHGAPMKGRLLCKVCKQNLTREELLEVISLTDFISGNFMTVIDSMVKYPQARNGSPDKDPLEKHIEYFFEKLEESVIDVIRKAKEMAIKTVRENKANGSAGFNIEHQRSFVNTKLEVVLKNWEENLYDDVLLNDLAKNFAELSNSLTTYLSKNSTLNQRKDGLIESLKVDGKYVTHLQELCQKHTERIIQKLKPQEEDNTIEIEDSTDNGEPAKLDGKKAAPQQVTRNKRRIQNLMEKQEKADKVEKKIKPSVQVAALNGHVSSDRSNDGDEIIVEIDNELYQQKMNTLLRINCSQKIQTKHKNVSWGGLCYVESKNHVVSGGFDGSINIWDADTKACILTRELKADNKVYKIVYVKERELLLVSSVDGCVHIFDVKKNYSLLVSFQAHPKQAFSVAYLSKMDLIASCGEDGNIALWSFDQQTNECSRKKVLDTNKRQVSCLCYIEDQNLLVAGMCKGGHIMIFQPDKTKCFRIAKAHDKEKSVDSLMYVPEWKQLISGSEDSYIKFWDFSNMSKTDSPNCLKALRREDSYIECIAVIPDENYLFHTNVDEYFTAWDLSQDKLVENYRGHTKDEQGEAILYLKNTKELVTAFADEIRWWNLDFSKN